MLEHRIRKEVPLGIESPFGGALRRNLRNSTVSVQVVSRVFGDESPVMRMLWNSMFFFFSVACGSDVFLIYIGVGGAKCRLLSAGVVCRVSRLRVSWRGGLVFGGQTTSCCVFRSVSTLSSSQVCWPSLPRRCGFLGTQFVGRGLLSHFHEQSKSVGWTGHLSCVFWFLVA